MSKKTFGIAALLAITTLTLVGCGKNDAPVENPDENAEIANPASVYCEENGGTLQLEEEDWLCMFDDGSYCEEWAFFDGECKPGEIIYNTVSDWEFIDDVEIKTDWNWSSEIYSDEDLQAAVDTIINTVNNEWQVKVEMNEIFYEWDETATSNLEYCKELASSKWEDVDDCVVFTSNFYIPEQDTVMAGSFEPDTNVNGYSWYLGRSTAWEWEVLTNGFG